MNDASDVVATADGQQQSPGEEGIGVKLNSLRAQGGPAAILPNVRAGEKALETLHGCINVLGGKRHAHIKPTSMQLNTGQIWQFSWF